MESKYSVNSKLIAGIIDSTFFIVRRILKLSEIYSLYWVKNKFSAFYSLGCNFYNRFCCICHNSDKYSSPGTYDCRSMVFLVPLKTEIRMERKLQDSLKRRYINSCLQNMGRRAIAFHWSLYVPLIETVCIQNWCISKGSLCL